MLVSTLIVFALQTAALFGLGRVLYGTPFPSAVGSLILAVIVGAVAFAALGVATASLIRSGEGSSAVVNFILLPMAFLTGSFGPTRHYPSFLRAIGDVLPLKYFIDLINAIYLKGHGIWTKPARARRSRRLGPRRPARRRVQVPLGAPRRLDSASPGRKRGDGHHHGSRNRIPRPPARRARARGAGELRRLRRAQRDGGRDRRSRAFAAHARPDVHRHRGRTAPVRRRRGDVAAPGRDRGRPPERGRSVG